MDQLRNTHEVADAQKLEKMEMDLRRAEHIFGNAPNMSALCLTTIGLVKIYTAMHSTSTLADNLLAICMIVFLLATVFAYLAMRAATKKRKLLFARLADASFLSGLGSFTMIALYIAYALAG